MKKILLAISAFIFILTGAIYYFPAVKEPVEETPEVLAGVSQGTQGDIATSTRFTVGATAVVITRGATATSTCSNRIITTRSSQLELAFATTSIGAADRYFSAPAGAGTGHLQLASTTVVYDSQFYGCGAIQAYSYTTQDITFTEVR